MAPHILLVDDDKSLTQLLSMGLKQSGYTVEKAESAEEAKKLISRRTPDIVITDNLMAGMSGFELLKQLTKEHPSVGVVMMTAQSNADNAVAAMKIGAKGYLTKPITFDMVVGAIKEIEESNRGLVKENVQLKSRIENLLPPPVDLTKSPRMQRAVDAAGKVATRDLSVFVYGEPGTGKSSFSKLIHEWSNRASSPFAVVSCASFSEAMLESEIFGHVKGAFKGATKDKKGLLEVTNGGTLVLASIESISSSIQARLLRFLTQKTFERVGDTESMTSDVRLIATATRDLKGDRDFNQQLYFTIATFDIEIPPLRQRPEDILPLAEKHLARAMASVGRPPKTLNEEARKVVLAYPWPGNITELRSAMERAAIISVEDQVTVADLPDRVLEPVQIVEVESSFAPAPMDQIEKRHLKHVLDTTSSLEEAASKLGVNLSTLWRKRKRFGLMNYPSQESRS